MNSAVPINKGRVIFRESDWKLLTFTSRASDGGVPKKIYIH